MTHETEFLVLGGGPAGLAAGVELGERALVVEREERPGGLVRAECFGGYWFDRVLHLLHFQDPPLQEWVTGMPDACLAPCPPVAWIDSEAGTARYPLQLNLGALQQETCIRALTELAAAASGGGQAGSDAPAYDDYLLRSFGPTLCDLFYFPYNQKMWRRPLGELAASGQTWNLLRPRLEDAVRGALAPNRDREAYNTTAFYPRPPAGAPVRGMEVLSRALARRVPRLHLRTTVTRMDLEHREVHALADGAPVIYRYTRGCLSTLPLPAAIAMSTPVPRELADEVRALPHNGVLSLAFSIRGARPPSPGHWRYYPDPALPFTRLVFMAEFDPLSGPADGWGVLAEVPYRADAPPSVREAMDAARMGLIALGLLDGCEIVDENVMVADPAYVVFTPGAEAVAGRARAHLATAGVTALGRYGRWEYSSIAGVMADARAWAAGAAQGRMAA
ncbi:MAG TPA: FAD-dependent oxidoreductase [Longimicrobium sp.]|jgi:protoporphyrinogen oxidase|uniref:protoporphyrinogen/coproporphyrinogen oxidase n=1 Tax=Longimicrobium sp. TaxID=2029185 RepID=UPI002EDA1DBD